MNKQLLNILIFNKNFDKVKLEQKLTFKVMANTRMTTMFEIRPKMKIIAYKMMTTQVSGAVKFSIVVRNLPSIK